MRRRHASSSGKPRWQPPGTVRATPAVIRFSRSINPICTASRSKPPSELKKIGRSRFAKWMDNGGGATLISYGQNYGDIVNVKVVPEQHLRWIEELPLMHADRHRVYVHAGGDPDLPLA